MEVCLRIVRDSDQISFWPRLLKLTRNLHSAKKTSNMCRNTDIFQIFVWYSWWSEGKWWIERLFDQCQEQMKEKIFSLYLGLVSCKKLVSWVSWIPRNISHFLEFYIKQHRFIISSFIILFFIIPWQRSSDLQDAMKIEIKTFSNLPFPPKKPRQICVKHYNYLDNDIHCKDILRIISWVFLINIPWI